MNGLDRRFWVGLGISAVLLSLFLATVDLGAMLTALSKAEYILLAPAIGLYLISVGFRTLRWRWLLAHMRRISFTRLYPVVVVGYMANNLLPLRLGELIRSHYVGEREGISKVSALVTIFIERLLDALTLLLFIAVIAVFVPLSGLAEGFGSKYSVAWPLLAALLSLPFLATFGVLLTIAAAPAKARAAAMFMVRKLPGRMRQRAAALIDTFFQGVAPLGNLRSLPLLFSISAPIWLFEAGLFFIIGLAFDLDEVYPSLVEMALAMVLVTAIANIGSSVPAAPGGLGLFELVARETLVLIPLATVDRAVAAGYVAVVHAALLLPMIVLGQVFLWLEQISLGRLSSGGQDLTRRATDSLAVAAVPRDGEEPE